MRFEFATATRIIFGPGTCGEAGGVAREFGRRALIATGLDAAGTRPLVESLTAAAVESTLMPVTGEPSIQLVEEGVARAREFQADLVVGFGGGSALDTAKAIAAMAANPGELLDYLEVVGRGLALPKAAIPFIAIPTTAGTGSEVTRNAVLASPAHRVKVSLRSPSMLAKVAIVDPDLTLDLPAAITASTGLDALTQVIEPYVCARTNPLVDGLCVEGITRAARSLRVACVEGRNRAAREDMCVTSLFGGMALANAGLGAVHGFAGPIGGMFPAPHGAVCASLLPHVMAMNIEALRERAPESVSLKRYDDVGRMLTGEPTARAQDGIHWVRQLVTELQIPPLRSYGLEPAHIPDLVEKARQASSMKPNPISLTTDELEEILMQAL